jgi:2-keto-4-pentenoate hydratase/2-oxohepta-3-ene-1,7-dioic acid hydratase in catechol pathway
MKVLMFREGNERRLGVIREGSSEEVVDVSQLAKGNGSSAAPSDILALIESGPDGLRRLRELVSSVKGSGNTAVVRQLKELSLLAPLDPPVGNMLAIGRNYEKHAAESARAWGENVKPPTVFTKARSPGPSTIFRSTPPLATRSTGRWSWASSSAVAASTSSPPMP